MKGTPRESKSDCNKRSREETSPIQSGIASLPARKKPVMDLSAFETMLDQKLDQKLKPLATKEDLEKQGEMLRKTINNLAQENAELKIQMDQLKLSNMYLIKKVDDLENRGRRNNLIIWGLQPTPASDCSQLLKDFFVEKLALSNAPLVNRSHILHSTGKNKAIIGHFPRDQDINNILKNCYKLAGTNFSVQRDFSAVVRKKRMRLLALLKEIKSKTQLKVKVVTDQLIVEGVKFSVSEDLEEILHQGGSGGKKLENMIGFDAEAILKAFNKNKKTIE